MSWREAGVRATATGAVARAAAVRGAARAAGRREAGGRRVGGRGGGGDGGGKRGGWRRGPRASGQVRRAGERWGDSGGEWWGGGRRPAGPGGRAGGSGGGRVRAAGGCHTQRHRDRRRLSRAAEGGGSNGGGIDASAPRTCAAAQARTSVRVGCVAHSARGRDRSKAHNRERHREATEGAKGAGEHGIGAASGAGRDTGQGEPALSLPNGPEPSKSLDGTQGS